MTTPEEYRRERAEARTARYRENVARLRALAAVPDDDRAEPDTRSPLRAVSTPPPPTYLDARRARRGTSEGDAS